MTGFWRTRRGKRGFCGHRHESAEAAARCAHMREVRYELIGEPADVVVVPPGDRELTGPEKLLVGKVMSGLSAPNPVAQMAPALPNLVSRAVLMAVQVAAEAHPELGPRAQEIASLALARLLVEVERMPAHRAPRVVFRAMEA